MHAPTWRTKLDLLVTIVMLGLVGWLGWNLFTSNGGPTRASAARIAVPSEPITLEGAHVRGDAAAPVAVVMYVDYGCGACRIFERETLPGIVRDYVDTGKILLAVRPFPLARRGEAGIEEAGLGVCAARHGKFWAAHAAMFENAGASSDAKQNLVAAATGLSMESLSSCLKDVRPSVRRMTEEARDIGVSGTPTFLIGRVEGSDRVVVSVAHQGISQGDEWFRQLLDPVVAADR